MRATQKIFLYGLFTLAVVTVFLYVRFPSSLIRDMIVSRVEMAQPELQVTAAAASPVFPPGLKLTPLALAYNDLPVVRMDFLRVVPEFVSLFRNEKQLDFNGPLGRGSLKGHAAVVLDERNPKINVVMNLANVPMDALQVLSRLQDYRLTGEMNAYVNFDSRKGAGGTAIVNTDIAPAKVSFNTPLLGLEQIEFTQVVAEMTVTPRMLQIKRCEALGPQIEGRITGSIIFRRPLQNSRLTLSCTLKPQPAFTAEHKNDILGGFLGSATAQKRGVIFRISGTIGNPSYVVR